MENQFNCLLILPLQEIALRKVAVLLWSGSDILAYILKSSYDKSKTIGRTKEWQGTLEDEFKRKGSDLQLPEHLWKDAIGMIRPISLDVRAWAKTHKQNFNLSFQNIEFKSLIFTPEGAVDYRKTAEQLVSCDGLDVKLRYEIAAYYCLEDYIPNFWTELPENVKCSFENFISPANHLLPPDLIYCWPHILEGRSSKLNDFVEISERYRISFNQFAFESFAERGNKSATEYFFQKLTDEEREDSLMRTAPGVLVNHPISRRKYTDTLRYLLTVMTPQQQMELVRERAIELFPCFFDWPWKNLFLENAELFWSSPVESSTYSSLLRKILNRFGDPYFLKWFDEYSKRSPPKFRELYENERYHVRHLRTFFNSSDSETIRAMFRRVDAADREELLFGVNVFILFLQSCMFDTVHLVASYFQVANLSRDEKRRMKETFVEYLESKISGPCIKRKFVGFFALFDETHECDDAVEVSEE